MMKEFLITVAAVIVAVVLVEQGKKMLAKKGA